MNRVMDGVRPTVVPSALRLTPSAPAPQSSARRVQPRRYVVGMDGIRRPVMPTAREALAAMHAPDVDVPMAPAMAAPAGALAAAAPMPVWQMPSLRLPQIGWRRPAIAFGLVATALVVSGTVVSVIASPQATTARATAVQPAPSPAAVAPAVAAPTPTPVPVRAGLQQLLDNFAAANPGQFGIVVKDMSTGETAAINPEQQFLSASLYKLFVAQRIYQRIDLGQLDYGSPAGGGTGKNVQDCLRVMINVSDNGCGRALGSILGWGAQDQALAIEGYKQTTMATPQKTSASDVATLYTRLYNGTLVSPAASEKFMYLLKDQRVNNRLPVGLPQGTVIAHKTGDLDGVVHDAGIVYGPKTNYMVVMTSGPWATPAGAAPKFADLSSQLWNYFEN